MSSVRQRTHFTQTLAILVYVCSRASSTSASGFSIALACRLRSIAGHRKVHPLDIHSCETPRQATVTLYNPVGGMLAARRPGLGGFKRMRDALDWFFLHRRRFWVIAYVTGPSRSMEVCSGAGDNASTEGLSGGIWAAYAARRV